MRTQTWESSTHTIILQSGLVWGYQQGSYESRPKPHSPAHCLAKLLLAWLKAYLFSEIALLHCSFPNILLCVAPQGCAVNWHFCNPKYYPIWCSLLLQKQTVQQSQKVTQRKALENPNWHQHVT
ncbi:hypothetical protein O6H91_23G066600 [Diphasiastrum complanatum]|uniref:Uncharacterized protein n=1 Tax=Diphasiastrum complanatum TaxID=34168 RepID=A0ACC2ABR7_DIPCM|nr:hypothetical protein O6H91_23G066600 [Diphasiastrum complanatum]